MLMDLKITLSGWTTRINIWRYRNPRNIPWKPSVLTTKGTYGSRSLTISSRLLSFSIMLDRDMWDPIEKDDEWLEDEE